MVIDVMADGALELGNAPSGCRTGIESARRVRLLHASVRAMLGASSPASWDAARYGVPINQEDLVGTLMTFSWITIAGLRKIGIDVSPRAAEGYLAAWCAVGRILGIAPENLPDTCEEAHALTEAIQRRQIRPTEDNPAGCKLTRALIDELDRAMPGSLLDPAGASMIRILVGDAIADSLGVPRRPFFEHLLRLYFWTRRVRAPFLRASHPSRLRRSGQRFTEQMCAEVERRGFELPAQIVERAATAPRGRFRSAVLAIVRRWLPPFE